jgi:hypothetical protein
MANSFTRKQLLAKKQEQVLIRRIALIVILTFGFIGVLAYYAIPAMVNIADAWETARNSNVVANKGDNNTIPLTRPSFQSLPYTATNSAEFVLKGYSKAGTTVFLDINSKDSGSVITDNSGMFTFGDITLNDGVNTFIAYSKDTDGRKSANTEPFVLTLDTRAPTLDITGPNYGDTFSGSQNYAEIKGTTSEATQMYVNDSWVIMNPDGSFAYKYQLKPGENTLTMYAKDDAGNKSVEVIRKVTYNP